MHKISFAKSQVLSHRRYRPSESVYLAFVTSIFSCIINLHFFKLIDALNFGYTRNFTGIAMLETSFPKLSSTLYLDTGSNFSEFSNFPRYTNTFREPLYPYYLKILNSIADYSQLIWIQRLLIFISLYSLFYLTTKNYGKVHTILLCTALNLFSAVPFFYSQLLYPFAISFTASSLALFALVNSNKRLIKYGLCGLLIGAATLERQQLLLFPFVFSVLILLRKGLNKLSARKISIFVLASFFAISPAIINGIGANFLGITSSQGYTLGYGYGAEVVKAKHGCLTSKYMKSFSESVTRYGADSGTLHFLGIQVISHNSTIAVENRKLSNALINCIKENPSMILAHATRNLVHFSDRMFTIKNPFMKGNLENYWDRHISIKPRFQNFSTFVGLIVTGYVLFQLVRRFRKIDYFELFTLTLLIATGFITLFTIYDPRYRINLDWLLYVLMIKYILEFFRSRKNNLLLAKN